MGLVKHASIVSVVRVLLILAGAFLIIGLLVRQMSFIDQQMIYFPDGELIAPPADVGLEYEDVNLTASDGVQLHGWFVPGEGRLTLLWFHGNAGNISHRVDNIMMLNSALGANIMIVDYRGYGRSQGSPSEKGLYQQGDEEKQQGVPPHWKGYFTVVDNNRFRMARLPKPDVWPIRYGTFVQLPTSMPSINSLSASKYGSPPTSYVSLCPAP